MFLWVVLGPPGGWREGKGEVCGSWVFLGGDYWILDSKVWSFWDDHEASGTNNAGKRRTALVEGMGFGGVS